MCLGHGQGQPGQGGIALTPAASHACPDHSTRSRWWQWLLRRWLLEASPGRQGEGRPGDSSLVSQGSGWVTGDGGTE